ncbi:SDR family NAD(P)-dependent oxidoreductase [Thalassococcus sp. S3]|uniref:SDR family NAD(P)-dependent oxidoreductase n=1 Tax=Thalassococcus sp. S3 TaxID=2017482 RepID=UPI0010242CC3|nr:SDR family oxidoreductase [Thalassococcus sp. S3]QBF32010.1 hypothetical protein CFI11_12370 [Thalassococcus sp. S3]
MSGTLAILGGCGGIGRALFSAAQDAGYAPLVFDLPDSIADHGFPDIPCIPVDATDPHSLAEAAADCPEDLAGLVNLCGFTAPSRPVLGQDAQVWENVLTGNLTSAFHAAQAFAPRIQTGGAMVLTGSGLGHYARPGFGPYAVSKAGIAALTRQLALECAPQLRVNCVAPSAVNTAFLTGGTGRPVDDSALDLDLDAYASAIPLGRIAEAEDVTGPILFLLSDAARYMTGQVLHINGGAYMP